MDLSSIPKLVINLPERTDRLENFVKQMKYLNCEASRVNGIKTHRARIGIAVTHMACINIAKASKWDKVLIMEDDVVFQGKEKTLPYLTEALKNVPDDWEVLLGGVYEARRITPVNEYWGSIGEFCSLHFYIVNSKAYDKILQWDGHHHIDRWVNKNGERTKCYVTRKFIATQSSGWSDNVMKRVDYTHMIKRFDLLC